MLSPVSHRDLLFPRKTFPDRQPVQLLHLQLYVLYFFVYRPQSFHPLELFSCFP